jgi:hypothetical protein
MSKERVLFDGKSLALWHSVPRLPVVQYPGGPEPDTASAAYKTAASTSGLWEVRDGAICGGQAVTGYGGYLLSNEVFGDFELCYEAKPDWPADTGVLVRASALGSQGYQILLDHRKSGNIGGFYGNGIGGFHAINFCVDADYDAAGKPRALRVEDPATTLEQLTGEKRSLLDYRILGGDFVTLWKWNDWNHFRVRCAGEFPTLTVWINGTMAAEINTEKMVFPRFDKHWVRGLLGSRGHIALEVHDNDPGMGEARWAPGALCRWRNITIREAG